MHRGRISPLLEPRSTSALQSETEGGAMPALVNISATIMCAHGGRVMLVPKQTTVMAGGAPVVCETDLMGAPIVGCALVPSPSTKPCTMVASTLPGGSSLKAKAGGKPIH